MILPFLQILGVIKTNTALPHFVRLIVDFWQTSPVPFTLIFALTGYTILVSMIAMLRYWQTVLQSRLSTEFAGEMRRDLYSRFIGAPWPYLASIKRGELFQNVQRDVGHIEAITQEILRSIGAVVVALVYVSVAIQLSAGLTAICLGAGCVIVLALSPLRQRIEASAWGVRSTFREIFSQIDERISMIKLVKSFGRDHCEIEEFGGLIDDHVRHTHRIARLKGLIPLAYAILGAVFLSLFVWLGSNVLEVPPEQILILIIIFSRLLPLISSLQTLRNHTAVSWPSLKSVRTREIELSQLPHTPPPPRDTQPCGLIEKINLRKVSFTYPGSSEFAIRDLDLTIHVNQITALVGPSGSGKSTLADLVLGLLHPDEGEITIDGDSLNGELLPRWRASTAYMPQEQLLLHDTIRANLLWAAPEASDEEIWEALKRASAEEFVLKLPDRLDTVLGERGARVSGGERQRISLARALLHAPTLLVLDEPTSALDAETETAIRDALNHLKSHLTILLIAHRGHLLEIADQVVDLSPNVHTS